MCVYLYVCVCVGVCVCVCVCLRLWFFARALFRINGESLKGYHCCQDYGSDAKGARPPYL